MVKFLFVVALLVVAGTSIFIHFKLKLFRLKLLDLLTSE